MTWRVAVPRPEVLAVMVCTLPIAEMERTARLARAEIENGDPRSGPPL
jgi:hypothetical protein